MTTSQDGEIKIGGSFSGKDNIKLCQSLSRYTEREGGYFRISMNFSCLENFMTFHGIQQNQIKPLLRQFLFPGYTIMGRYGGPKDHIEEALEIVAKWGKDYKKDKGSREGLKKKQRLEEMRKELALARDGKGPHNIGRRWCSLGGKGESLHE